MIIGITSIVNSLIYFVIVSAIYFKKNRVKNFDNKIYSIMCILNIIGLILELGCYYYVYNLDKYPLYNEFVNRLFLIYIVSWSFVLMIYEFNEIFSSNKKVKRFLTNNSKILNLIVFMVYVITLILVIFSELKYYNDGVSIYSYGLATNIVFTPCIISFIIGGISIFINRKNINLKKLIPFFTLFFILGIAIFIRITNPGYLFITPLLTLVTFLMYFTIENPDVKMINELELAKNQAEKANRAKTDFLSSMSHEIRTPLNAIVGLSNIIKDSNDLAEIHEDASDVVSASNTLLEIVNGILDISRIEADKMEIVEVSYNPLEEFKSLVNLTETRIGEKKIELRSEFAIDLPNTLYGDKGKVKQIITNLLTNAVKYTEKGHIDFKVSCINEKDVSKLTITVSDTGRGIKKEQMDTLFTKFNRLEEDKNTTIEGTGLGLAITKSLVEMMGGKIVVDSTYGEGSKFTVFLCQKITNDATIEKEETINTFDGKKVLIVDDNKLNIKVASKILKEFNLDIDECESGFECINKIENNNQYDIIFMDIMMPKMSGTETLKKLKQIENFNIPVVALTADAFQSQGKSNKYLEVGFNDYLSKPIDKNELNKVLSKILNNVEVEEKKTEEDPDIHKVTPITDEQIAELNRLFGEPTLISQDEKNDKENTSNTKGNIDYLKENDIDVDASIELLGDMEMYNETLNTFINENKERMPRIEKNKNEGNMKDYSIDVHALKSDSKYLGFKKLAELSYGHELKSKENDIDYINNHYDELMNEYNRIKEIIEKYL